VRNASGGRINLGPGRAELEHDRLVEIINTPLAEARRIAVVCRKGGCGKTTTSLMLGHTFAVHRRDRVVALDANPDAGSLGERVRQRSEKTITDLLADRELLTRYADIQRYASKTPTGLDIVGSDNDPRISQRLGEEDYRHAIDVLDRFYNIIVPDTGTGIMDPAVQGVLAEADQLVLVIPPALDGARVAASTLDWLENHGHEHLVHSSVGVISAVRGPSALELDLVEEHFAGRCAAVVKIPWDPALSVGGSATLDDLLPATRNAYLDLAVAVAGQFGTESHRGAQR
jgi:putative peptide zinc metalloprotease protein